MSRAFGRVPSCVAAKFFWITACAIDWLGSLAHGFAPFSCAARRYSRTSDSDNRYGEFPAFNLYARSCPLRIILLTVPLLIFRMRAALATLIVSSGILSAPFCNCILCVVLYHAHLLCQVWRRYNSCNFITVSLQCCNVAGYCGNVGYNIDANDTG